MDIGIPKESRQHEHRVALTPAGVKALLERGHRVYVETGAGSEAGHADADFESAGATIVYSRQEAFQRAELVLAVIAPEPAEYPLLQPQQAVLGFWMLPAARAEDLKTLISRQVTAIGLEVAGDAEGHAPALIAMSEIAGPLAVVIGAGLLLNEFGGKGILLSGAPGVPPANLVVIGAGALGRTAACAAVGMGAEVLLLDVSIPQLRAVRERLPRQVPTMFATAHAIERALSFADLVISAPALRGERAPVCVSRAMLRRMKPRSVVMDLAIDMGGSLETSRPTYFPSPTYEAEGILHFCVPNLPSIVARSATTALTNTVLPWVLELAEKGAERALRDSEELRRGTYLHHGKVLSRPLAELFKLPYQPLDAGR